MRITLRELKQWRDSLIELRLKGIREIEDQNGERIVYKSDSEMAAAIRAVEQQIVSFAHRIPHTIILKSSKGL